MNVAFYHDLAACTELARIIQARPPGAPPVGIECSPQKRLLFEAAGANVVQRADVELTWNDSPESIHEGHGKPWQGNRALWNARQSGLISDQAINACWLACKTSDAEIMERIDSTQSRTIEEKLADVPRPVIALRLCGDDDGLEHEMCRKLCREFVDRFDGTLLLLDGSGDGFAFNSWRVRLAEDLRINRSTDQTLAMIDHCDLVIGVDSTELRLAPLTGTPSVIVWKPGDSPIRSSLPHNSQLHIVVSSDEEPGWTRFHRIEWNLLEHSGRCLDAQPIAELCLPLVREPRYFEPPQITFDAQMQLWIREWCRSDPSRDEDRHRDRNRSLDLLFRVTRDRFSDPVIVETGTIRAEEDWSGAGFFTYLAATYVARRGGHLHTVDIDPETCAFARKWCTSHHGGSVSVHCRDSVEFLEAFERRIDVLYLDSLDTYTPGFAEHAMRELKAAEPRLSRSAIVVCDDTPLAGNKPSGKGKLIVPYLLERGWNILYGGYQVLLSRNAETIGSSNMVSSA